MRTSLLMVSRMCKWGTNLPAKVLSRGCDGTEVVMVDACIRQLVEALNAGGIRTIGCCCGHGKGKGSILLADGQASGAKRPPPPARPRHFNT